MKAWFFSDTHENHKDLSVPHVDIAFFCGDEANHMNPHLNEFAARGFFEWFNRLPVQHKIYIPGNHSTAFEQGLIDLLQYPSVNFLVHGSMVIEGLKIFGSPYTPEFGRSQAYMKDRGHMDAIWSHIPEDADIVITHGPPKGVMDLARDHKGNKQVEAGCASLRNRIKQVAPAVHAFGHIHDEPGIKNFGRLVKDGTTYINCACTSEQGLMHNGIVVDLARMPHEKIPSI